MTEVEILQANQIGGCVTVVSTTINGKTHRIMIDYGCSLEGSETKEDIRYPWNERPIDAVFFTHYHGDHVGRLMEIPDNVPLYMGGTARQVMINIQEALAKIPDLVEAESHKRELEVLQDDKRIQTFQWNGHFYEHIKDITGFVIEPYSVDHSAYDAYMFLIEATDDTMLNGKKVILHTGDFRGHGRRGKIIPKMIDYYIRKKRKGIPGRDVDILVTEGTMMNRDTEKVRTEPEMQKEAELYLRKHKYAFLICSSTNLDSLASFYQAAQEAAKPYESYLYTYSPYYKTQLKTFTQTAGRFSDVYKFDHVYVLELDKVLSSPRWRMTQQELMRKTGFLATIKPEERFEKYIDAFLQDYHEGIIKEKPVIIYSMWDGYVDKNNKAKNQEWVDFLERQEAKGVEVKQLHTSGHATIEMIEAVITAVDPKEAILPIHTENAEKFKTLNICDELKNRIVITDGE